MIKKYPKFILLIILVILIALSLGILNARKQRQKEEKELITETYAPTPKIPKEYKGQIDKITKFSVDGLTLKFPGELPLLEVSYKNIALADAKQIASNLKITSEPMQYDDFKDGLKYIWSSENQSLIITPKTSQISYSLGFIEPPKVENKNLENNTLDKIAQNFLSDKIGLSKDKIKLVRIANLVLNPQSNGFSETTDKSKAALFQLNYTYKTSEYEILTLSPSQPLIYVQILTDGNIYSSEITLFDNAKESSQKYLLKEFDDIKRSINEAVLISLLNDYLNISELNKDQIEEITIDKITLAYLLESTKTSNLKPVFLLEGPAKVKNSSANWVQLYMPALKY
ncbi:hypothetical protein A2159_00315 [Candidatus Woesebacteria bacterium RBG_13_34_9]|uniref:Uncharacterized protein n=1 Tax=Candidatus Woesebacteria bacterium RBG_13_34_9 TaxID=1802477 RepID=A0A1F7X3A0_9BACT|nr:MAG: hypothetical protein A2159_00315 [Candidatus Woesebacteria bacterium RBG_13_34_9]